jgi:hypothetical protein
MGDIFIEIKMTRVGLDAAVCTVLSVYACLLQMWLILRLPGDGFVASWNPLLWIVASGLVAFGSTFIVLTNWAGDRQWAWIIDLIVMNIVAIFSMVVLVRILRPADDFISVLLVATLFHLVPALMVNLVVFLLMTLIDRWRNPG